MFFVASYFLFYVYHFSVFFVSFPILIWEENTKENSLPVLRSVSFILSFQVLTFLYVLWFSHSFTLFRHLRRLYFLSCILPLHFIYVPFPAPHYCPLSCLINFPSFSLPLCSFSILLTIHIRSLRFRSSLALPYFRTYLLPPTLRCVTDIVNLQDVRFCRLCITAVPLDSRITGS